MASVSGTSDITSYVAQLIDLERQSGPEKTYKQDKQDLTSRSATLTDLRTTLSSLNTQVQALLRVGTLSPVAVKTVKSSNTSVATATATTAANGTHSLLVTQLAKHSTVVSTQWSQGGADLIGSVGAGERTVRVSVNGLDTDVGVSLEAGDDNQAVLTKLAAAINGSDAKISASVVKDSSTTARLVLTSDESGAANAIALSDVSGSLAAATGANGAVVASGTTGGALYTPDQLNAHFVLDGLAITRSTNVVSDVLSGVTLTLLAPQATDAAPATLTIGPNGDAVQKSVQAFLDTYNAALKFLKERTSVSVSTDTSASGSTEVKTVNRGTLASDPRYMSLIGRMRSAAVGRVSGVGAGGPAQLADIGITVGTDGTLSISSSEKFSAALEKSAEDVAALFNGADGVATRLGEELSRFIQTGGLLDTQTASLQSQLESVNRSIKQQEDYLKVKQETLLQQYTTIQEMLLQLQSQQSAIEAWLASGL